MLMVPFEYIKGFPSKSMRIQRGSLRETISNLRKLNTIWMEILRISFECISDFPKILKNLMRNLRTPLGNWRESLQFDDNSKRNSDGTPGNVKGDPLRTRRELKKRRLNSLRFWRGSPLNFPSVPSEFSLNYHQIERIPSNFPRVSSNVSSNS